MHVGCLDAVSKTSDRSHSRGPGLMVLAATECWSLEKVRMCKSHDVMDRLDAGQNRGSRDLCSVVSAR